MISSICCALGVLAGEPVMPLPAPVVAGPEPAPQQPIYSEEASPWRGVMDRLTFYGDTRFRLETNSNPPSGDSYRRMRLRVRLGADYVINDEVTVGARLTTGSQDDPLSSNTTLGDGFEKIELNLDRLFLTWRPQTLDPFSATFGKFAHPFTRNPVYDELVWYSVAQPEGFVLQHDWAPAGFAGRVGARAGYYIVEEDRKSGAGAGVAELFSRYGFGRSDHWDLSLAYYGYSHTDEFLGGTGTTPDYDILDLIGSVTLNDGGGPWKLSFEGINNVSVSGEAGRGWALGAGWGTTAKQADWRAYYQYQQLGNDSVFGLVANDDFMVKSNFRGHASGVNYQFTDAIGLHFWTLISTPLDADLNAPGDTDGWSTRIRFDLNVKF